MIRGVDGLTLAVDGYTIMLNVYSRLDLHLQHFQFDTVSFPQGSALSAWARQQQDYLQFDRVEFYPPFDRHTFAHALATPGPSPIRHLLDIWTWFHNGRINEAYHNRNRNKLPPRYEH